MKVLIPIVIGLLVAGCGEKEQPKEKSDNETPPKSTKAKPVKELTLREKAVGAYEKRISNGILRYVFLKNGVLESYENGEKLKIEAKWEIVDGELHVELKEGGIIIYRIDKDGSITYFARIDSGGKRSTLSKEKQPTYSRIK